MRQVVELDVPARQLARRLQDRTSGLQRERLVPLLERLCSEASPPGRIDRIERLELDLGEIPEPDFEAVLVERLTRALGEALPRHIEQSRVWARQRGEPPAETRAALESFAVFARTGRMPWWVDTRKPRLLPTVAQWLVANAPESTAALMRELGHSAAALQRLALALEDDGLAGLCELMASSGAERHTPPVEPRAGALARSVVALVRGSAAVLGVSSVRLRTAAWQSALHEAASSEGGTTQARTQRILVLVALHLHTTYRAVLSGIVQSLRASAAGGSDDGVAELGAELLGPLYAALPGARSAIASETAQPDDVPAEAALPMVEPGRDQASAARSLADEGAAPSAPSEVEPLLTPRAEPDSRPSTEAHRRAASPPTVAKRALRPRLRSGSDERPWTPSLTSSGDFHIDDAGLVLLGPFLSRLFETVELLDDRRFRDPAAQHRAAGLLHHLVTEALTPVEYQLPLAKVLCGLDVDVVLEFDQPVTEAEVEACQHLLSAVVDHAPILHRMSTAGLRSTFLARSGVLGPRDGTWLLRVERETYDVVLGQVPWTFDWVRLPWMDAFIRVEWS